MSRARELLDRAGQDDLLQIRNDLMTVYREISREDTRLFPLRYARMTPRPGQRRPDAVPVLVLPDGPAAASVLPYDALRRSLASAGVDVLMMEHRGVGLSRLDAAGHDLPARSMQLTQVLRDIVAVLDHARVTSAAVYGVGYGAYLAQALAALHPERVHGLVLDSPLTSADDELVSQQALRAAYWEGTVPGTDTLAATVRRLVADGSLDGRRAGPVLLAVHEHSGLDAVRELVDLLGLGRGQLTFASVRQVLAQGWLQSTPYVTEHDLVARILHTELGSGHHADGQPLDALQLAGERSRAVPPFDGEPWDLHALSRQITAPVLVLSGRRDLVTPPSIAHDLAERLPAASILDVPGTGHSVLDTHSRLAQVAIRWASVGAQRELTAHAAELARLPRTPLTQALVTGVRLALAAERYSPIRLWVEAARSRRLQQLAAPTSRHSRTVHVP